MSGGQAYLSFANYLTDALSGSGITVGIEKQGDLTPPYLRLSDGPEEIISRWISSKLCQAWVVVEKQATEPLVMTEQRAMQKVILATQDVGSIPKYNYETTPTQQTGLLTVKIQEITGDMSNDPLRSKRVITWEILSNSKS